ncbi:DnaA regulatory inactivator Hda [Flocculibacter collagenilyticus]|uniref:DnaA regulatory inactivator Hda n=1 Tax=Flocculibacter collagenilyticus TaxID=2744479 RepID=UPI0018F6E737|nr:DnaA regulatory inactivator Hda [Flocculibacter collagenilyticus]
MPQPQQIALPVTLPDDETFTSYWPAGNEVVVDHLKNSLNQQHAFSFTYLYGSHAVGKSHLLYASCVKAQEKGLSNMLLPMSQLINMSTDVLAGLQNLDLVCIEQFELIEGNKHWEQAMFNLFNSLNYPSKTLLIASAKPVDSLDIKLKDLTSRLKWGTTFQINPLSDEQKALAIQHRASLRGLELSEESAAFLINRLDRNMTSLIETLDKLDRISMQKQRKLTIPFIKDELSL